jgi:hypothetical protein
MSEGDSYDTDEFRNDAAPSAPESRQRREQRSDRDLGASAGEPRSADLGRGAGTADALTAPWWTRSNRFDPRSCLIADRHYNRRKVGSPQFVPPGRNVVFRHDDDALWTTSWPFAEYVRHAWPGAWINSLFRNESDRLSSELIREAVAHTLAVWPDPPDLGMVTFVNAAKVRRKRDPGRCYLRAGFRNVGETKGGLVALQLVPADMPDPWPCSTLQGVLL